MAWFAYNATHIDGQDYLYQEFPEHFVFIDKRKQWQKRQ